MPNSEPDPLPLAGEALCPLCRRADKRGSPGGRERGRASHSTAALCNLRQLFLKVKPIGFIAYLGVSALVVLLGAWGVAGFSLHPLPWEVGLWCLLVVGLGRQSRYARSVLIAWQALGVFQLVLISSGESYSAGFAVLSCLFALQIALLWSLPSWNTPKSQFSRDTTER